jgi:hypothetical protein
VQSEIRRWPVADPTIPQVAVYLPADLVAKLEEVKQDREDDRNKSVQELVQEFCQSYVNVREMARWELAHMDELNRSYEENPNDDWDDDWSDVLPEGRQEDKT